MNVQSNPKVAVEETRFRGTGMIVEIQVKSHGLIIFKFRDQNQYNEKDLKKEI